MKRSSYRPLSLPTRRYKCISTCFIIRNLILKRKTYSKLNKFWNDGSRRSKNAGKCGRSRIRSFRFCKNNNWMKDGSRSRSSVSLQIPISQRWQQRSSLSQWNSQILTSEWKLKIKRRRRSWAYRRIHLCPKWRGGMLILSSIEISMGRRKMIKEKYSLMAWLPITLATNHLEEISTSVANLTWWKADPLTWVTPNYNNGLGRSWTCTSTRAHKARSS